MSILSFGAPSTISQNLRNLSRSPTRSESRIQDLSPSAYVCGRSLRARHPTGTLTLASQPCSRHVARRRFFFAMLKNVHYACAPFTKSPIAQPAPPTQLPPPIIATITFSLQFDKNFPDFTKGFFAHGHYKSRALRAKTIAAFSYPYAQKPFWDEKSCKNRARLFGGGKPPNPQKTEGGKVAFGFSSSIAVSFF